MQSFMTMLRELPSRRDGTARALLEPESGESTVPDQLTQGVAFKEELGLTYDCLLRLDDGTVDVRSEFGKQVACFYLAMIEASLRLAGRLADRDYRERFPGMYRQVFRSDPRYFRIDVLGSCFPGASGPCVNGRQFILTRQTQQQGQTLYCAWTDLMRRMEHWRHSGLGPSSPEVWAGLSKFDSAYATFERMYIAEVSTIDDHARLPLQEAIKAHEVLQRAEDLGEPEERLLAKRACLVKCVGHLSSVANTRALRQDDLNVAIWQRAATLLRRCQAGDSPGWAQSNAGRLLARGVLDSVVALREYLAEASRQPDRLHPDVSKNQGLVERLVDVEKSWQMFDRFAASDGPLTVLGVFERHLTQVGQMAPCFATMCEDKDAEIFVVLPRLLLLCYLQEPHVYAVVHGLLPLRSRAALTGAKLIKLKSLFGGALQALSSELGSEAPAAWETLVWCAVHGQFEHSESAVSALMHQLEGLSVDLQRHNPTEWNRWAEMALQCLENKPILARRFTLGPEFHHRPAHSSVY